MTRSQRPPTLDAPEELKERLAQSERRLREINELKTRRWLYDPVKWVDEVIDFPRDQQGLTDYQRDTLSHLVYDRRVSVRAPHGTGKTTTNAIAILWFATTRDIAGIDWKIPTTAGAWRQLEKFLWPEVHKWAKHIRWDVLGRPRFTQSELLDLALKLPHGEAFAVAASDPMLIEGAHADSLFYVFDEAKSIAPGIFDASEGAFSGSRPQLGQVPEAFGLAQSTPGAPEGRFWEIQTHKPGFGDWHSKHITLREAIGAGRITPEWADARKAQWGARSQLYCNRVLGEFKDSEGNSVIPLAWIEAAVERWNEWDRQGGGLGVLSELGVDVAREGDDETVLAFRHGHVVHHLQHEKWDDTTVTASWVSSVLHNNPEARAIIDVIGIGAGVFDMVRVDHGKRVSSFQAAEHTDRKDRSGQLSFSNARAAAWWHLRDLLDPAAAPIICLPDDDTLLGDLSAPQWKTTLTGKVQLESKKEIKDRIHRSPDAGDAVVMAFWPVQRQARMLFAGRVGRREVRVLT